MTVKFNDNNYRGFKHTAKVTYIDCTIKGVQFLYAPEVTFTNCIFNVTGDAYAVWTYGASNVSFNECVFNTDGKAVLVYTEAAHTATINVSDCTFNATTNRSKAAVEVGQSAYDNEANYTLNISNSPADTNFVANISTSNLWGNKNRMDHENLIVNLDGMEVTAPYVDMSGITLNDKDYDGAPLTYSGEAKISTYRVEDLGFEGKFTYAWYEQDGSGAYVLLDEAPVHAGSYKLVATVDEEEISRLQSNVGELPVTIAKAKPELTLTADPDSMTLGGVVTLTVSGVPADSTAVVTCPGATVWENEDGTWSAVLVGFNSAYTFTATCAETDNYEAGKATCTVFVEGFEVPDLPPDTPDEPDVPDVPDVPDTPSRPTTPAVPATNRVDVQDADHGDVNADHVSAEKGETITVTVDPDKGYELDELTVTDSRGNEIELTDKGNGKYTFTMPGRKVTVEASFKKIGGVSFSDVPPYEYFSEAVQWAVENGVTTGTSPYSFGPYENCTRAQAVTFLWRAVGSPAPTSSVNPFVDVDVDDYYYKAVLWAYENGITGGTTATTFSPDEIITRAQVVTFLYRLAGEPTVNSSNIFSDVAEDAYYVDAVKWAVENGITNGTDNWTFSPDQPCNRAQIVTFLFRYFEK